MHHRSTFPSNARRRLCRSALLVPIAALFLALGAAPAAALSFAPPAKYVAGHGPAAIAVGDFNGDGKPDLVTANSKGNSVGVLFGTGGGRFTDRVPFPAGAGPGAVAVGDFNGDGAQDLVTANARTASVSVLLGDGYGRFAAQDSIATGSSPAAVAVGDFNGDGAQDLVTANYHSADGTASVLLGDGAGGFAPRIDVATGPASYDIAVGDFNSDGRQDLATVMTDWLMEQGVGVLLGDGEGHFSPMSVFGTSLEPVAVAVGDMNGDGRQDLVSAQRLEGVGEIAVLLGDGSGVFAGGRRLRIDRETLCVTLGDANGDGRQDVVSAKGSVVIVLRGDGRGGLASPLEFSAGARPADVAVADLNGDGLQDLATANYGSDSVSVLLNGPRAAPALRAISPVRARIGAVVTLTGARFGAARHASVVRFGAAAARDYVSWSSTRIKVRVPQATARGCIKVTVRTVAGSSAAQPFRRL